MDVKETSMQYEVAMAVSPNVNLVLTYDGEVNHANYGICRMRIHRQVRSDNPARYDATVQALKESEPEGVGFWPGDMIFYFDKNGRLLEVEH